MSVGKFLAGVVVGGAIGAIAGILLAPQEGAKTREMLGDMADDVAERTNKTVKEIQDKADSVVSDMQAKGEEIIGKIQDLIGKQKMEHEQG